MQVGLNEVTQIFQIAIGEHALASIGFENRFELRQIDTDDYGSLLREQFGQRVGAAVPAFIARQHECKAAGRSGRSVDRKILESAVAQVRRTCRSKAAQHGHGRQHKRNFHRLVTLDTQNSHR